MKISKKEADALVDAIGFINERSTEESEDVHFETMKYLRTLLTKWEHQEFRKNRCSEYEMHCQDKEVCKRLGCTRCFQLHYKPPS